MHERGCSPEWSVAKTHSLCEDGNQVATGIFQGSGKWNTCPTRQALDGSYWVIAGLRF